MVRRGLSLSISAEPGLTVCGEAADGGEALEQFEATHPDLIVIDISLGGADGIELIRQIKSRCAEAKMLVYSMLDESLFAERALRAGAMGYVNKAEAAEKLIEAIRQVLDGHICLSSEMADRLFQRMRVGQRSLECDAVETLSNREIEVFEMIGHGQSTEKIAQTLHLSPKTVETYRENIKRKLNLSNSVELIRHAVKWVLRRGKCHEHRRLCHRTLREDVNRRKPRMTGSTRIKDQKHQRSRLIEAFRSSGIPTHENPCHPVIRGRKASAN